MFRTRSAIPILVFLVISYTQTTEAQTIRLSQKYTTETVANPTFTSFTIKNHLYVVQEKFNTASPIKRDVQVDVFDSNGEFISSTGVVDANMNPGEPNIYEGIFAIGGKMTLFKSLFVKEGDTKHYDLYCYPYSNHTQRGQGTKIASTYSESIVNTGNFYKNVSPDGSKVAVLVQHPFKKGARESCTVIVFDDSFKELWSKKYDFPFDNVKSPDNILWVNNRGSVFVLKNVENKTEDPYQSIISFTNGGNDIKDNKLILGQAGKLSSYGSALTGDGDLIIAGLYFNDKKFGVNVEKPKGTFLLKINDNNGAVSTAAIVPNDFPAGTKTTGIILVDNEEIVLTAEEQLVKSTPIPDKPLEYKYEYVNGNIYVHKLNSKGELQWQHTIKREVKSFNDGAKSNSVFTGIVAGNISLIYRDYFYKYDGKQHTVVGPVLLSKFINVHRTLALNGDMIADTFIKRLGDDETKEAVVIYVLPQTGKMLDERNAIFMGCTEKILYGVKVAF